MPPCLEPPKSTKSQPKGTPRTAKTSNRPPPLQPSSSEHSQCSYKHSNTQQAPRASTKKHPALHLDLKLLSRAKHLGSSQRIPSSTTKSWLGWKSTLLKRYFSHSCNVSLSMQYMAVKRTTNRRILLNGPLHVTPDVGFRLTGSLLFGP